MTNPQQWWKIESISPKVRNKTSVPTLTTTIQHSFRSFGHSNQRRKRNKRNPDWKRRSKILTVCRWYDSLHAAAAKSLQSCPTLCDPIDSSLWGSPVPGILQERTLEWVAISFSKILCIENPKNATQKLLELINEYSKVTGYKINTQKFLIFLYMSSSNCCFLTCI